MATNAIPDVGAPSGGGVASNNGVGPTLSDYYQGATPVQQRINDYLAAQQKDPTNQNLWSFYLNNSEFQTLNEFFAKGGGSATPGSADPNSAQIAATGLGNSAASAVPDTSSTPVNSDDIISRLTSSYPGLAGILQIPDMASALAQIGQNPAMPPAQMLSIIQATPWYKNTPDTARQWAVAVNTDPGTAKRLLIQQTDAIRQLASQNGTPLNENQIMWLGLDANQNGWSTDQLKQRLTDLAMPATGDSSTLTGEAGNTAQTLGAMAKGDYATPISNQALYQWSRGIMDGTQTQDGFQDYIKEQAKSMYPGMAAAIDQGTTVKQFADPYVQAAASTLEINPDSIDLTDPKWNKMLNQVGPDGTRQVMSISDATQMFKTDPTYGWDHTVNAMNAVSDTAAQIGKMFGATG